jgi:osmotically-inducible protein OsmY
MPNDRYRYDRDRFRERDDERGRDRGDHRRREDDGYIARRAFGNESAGYDRGRSDEGGRSGFERGGYARGADERYGEGHERDFGDSAGYGTGGSTRDWRDVMGEDRSRGGRHDRSSERGYGAGFFGRDESSRYGASDFGRGSRGDDDERGFLERAGDEVRSWFGDDDAERRRMRDSREGDQGYHRGRGPKNYQRSDDRIRDDVNDRLTDDPHVDASEIDVSVQNREVTLTGTVNSRFEKRHAEDIAESVSGVAHVQNNLRVQQPAGMPGSSMSGAATGAGSGSASGSGLDLGAAGPVVTSNSAQASGVPGQGGTRRRTSSTSGS